MATTSARDLRPRPLYDDDVPEPGDVHFAVGFGRRTALVSKIIAAGTASRTNHVGVIVEADNDHWVIVEALGAGVIRSQHRPPPQSTVLRVSDDPTIRAALAAEASRRQSEHRIRYDWWTIARIVLIGLLGRCPFVFIPMLALPPIARYVAPLWVGPVAAVALFVALYKARTVLFRVAVAIPWPDPHDRMICSEFTRRCIETVFGPDALPGLKKVTPSMTSPGDLLQELLHRADYRFGPQRRIRHANTDSYPTQTPTPGPRADT